MILPLDDAKNYTLSWFAENVLGRPNSSFKDNLFGMKRCVYVQNFMTLGQWSRLGHEICLFKLAFLTVCYSAPLWWISVRFASWHCGMIFYYYAKFCLQKKGGGTFL